MIGLRFLVIVTALVTVALVAGYLLTGERRWLRWAMRILQFAGIAALVFFVVLFLERLG